MEANRANGEIYVIVLVQVYRSIEIDQSKVIDKNDTRKIAETGSLESC